MADIHDVCVQSRAEEQQALEPYTGLKRKHDSDLSSQSSKDRQKIRCIEPPLKQEEEADTRETHNLDDNCKSDPITYWAAHGDWPKNFGTYRQMSSSTLNKRQRSQSQSSKDERRRSYSQSRRDGDVPQQYTRQYETHLATKGLEMDLLKGKGGFAEESKQLCASLLENPQKSISPIMFPEQAIERAVQRCRNRNEALIYRDITSLIITPITSLYLSGEEYLEHVVDEVNADWYQQCVLEGPQLRPDLAIGLFSSAFTAEEIEKLKRYSSVDNWAQFTSHMYFPFLMCEVKCGNDGLDIADRQNMHSCSVAVRALCRIEEEANKFRAEKKEPGQILVFSISHNHQDAHLFAHYAVAKEEKQLFYRHRIRKFDLTDSDGLLAIHSCVRNVLKHHMPAHVARLKDAIGALPEPIVPSGSSLDDESSENAHAKDADGFVVPALPSVSQTSEAMLLLQLKESEERSRQAMAQAMAQAEERHREQMDKLFRQMEEQRKDTERERQEERRVREEEQRVREVELKEKEGSLLQIIAALSAKGTMALAEGK